MLPSYWSSDTLKRLITDIIWAQWRKQRPDSHLTPSCLAHPKTRLTEQLHADSLEIFQIATSVAVFFELHQTGVETELLADPNIESWVTIVKKARQGYDQTLRFASSGSTGQPKYTTHRLDHLLAETEFWAQHIPMPQRILCCVPSHHIYGFIFSVLLPNVWQAQNPQLKVVDFRQYAPSQLSNEKQKTLLIGFPDLWRTLIQFNIPLPDQLTAISSTAPCPPQLALGLQALGLKKLFQIYGSSETAGIGWRDTVDGPYQLLPHLKPQPFSGATQGETRSNTKIGPTSDRNQQPHTSTHLINTQLKDAEPYPLQDHLTWHNAASFSVGARIDKAVQVGGQNVYPNHVANILKHIEGIDNASVRLMQPEEGDRLKAFVVTQVPPTEYAALQARIEQFCEQHLQPMERPKRFTFGSQLPQNALGKTSDWSSET